VGLLPTPPATFCAPLIKGLGFRALGRVGLEFEGWDLSPKGVGGERGASSDTPGNRLCPSD